MIYGGPASHHVEREIFEVHRLFRNCFVLYVCLGFMVYQPFQVIKYRIYLYTNKNLYFKQFSSAKVHNLVVKNKFPFSANQLSHTVLIQTTQSSTSVVFVYTELNVKTVLFQPIQFSIIKQFNSIWPIEWTLSGATSPGQSVPGNDCSEGVFRILQGSIITGTSPADCLV